MESYRSITKYIIVLALALGLGNSLSWANTRTFLVPKLFFIDSITGLSYDADTGLGVGGQAAASGLTVSGNARFNAAVASVPYITTNASIDWSRGAHQFLTIENSATTQNITFVNPTSPCMLVLVLYRNIGVTLPAISWQAGATITFPKPDTSNFGNIVDPATVGSGQAGYEEDVIGLIYDGTSYIGIANKNFKNCANITTGVSGS